MELDEQMDLMEDEEDQIEKKNTQAALDKEQAH